MAYSIAEPSSDSIVSILRTGLDIINGISSNRTLEICTLDLGENNIIDFKFLGTRTLTILCNNAGE